MPMRRSSARFLNLDAALPVPAPRYPSTCSRAGHDVLSARLGVEAADSQRLSDRAAFYPDIINLKALAGIGVNILWLYEQHNGAVERARGWRGSLDLAAAVRWRPSARAIQEQRGTAGPKRSTATTTPVLRAVQQTADQLTRIDALARERVEQQHDLGGQRGYAYRKLAEEALPRGPAGQLFVRTQCRDPSAHRAANDGRHHRGSSRGTGDPAFRHWRQLRRAHIGKYCDDPEFSSSFDTGNTMNTNESKTTTAPGATPAAQPAATAAPASKRSQPRAAL